ncbi:glycoside hydrolase family 2 protein [Paenibacillus sp. JZ16]|uniref:glycoside hydrolase family 2 protein n=1 Tax=Paenibacillus sp. JZ16 TaxID=1906272 RepID=UPI00188B17BF|nr:glycoside hydrolase family 2 TIM barrel-domain containing protein [Paenibacillus sp. JZ16]
MVTRQTMEWEVGWSDHAGQAPDRWVPATVPGAVQLDWARAEGWGDHTYGENWRQYEWMEDKTWTYRAWLRPPASSPGERLYFISKGIDYSFHIRLDGTELLQQEGMFTPVELDLTERLRGEGGLLEIVIDPVPKRLGAPRSRDQADHSCKPAVSYGWDWHPRLIPLGIWDDTYLVVRPEAHLASSEVRYELTETLDEAALELQVRLSQPAAGELQWRLIGPEGETVFEEAWAVNGESPVHAIQKRLSKPRLWWPHDHGEQPLYRSEVSFKPADSSGTSTSSRHQRIGFRRARLVMHEGAWKEPSQFPKSRSNPPITMEINGRQIFCKGTNWVNPDIFPGRIRAEDYGILLDLAKAAHMNMLRVWGGGIVNKESFFERCDEIGLMVWQEFPLACNQYPDTPAYLRVLDQESRSIIERLRRHASVVLWCGGNELFNSWSKMTDQSLPLRLLNANCYMLDPRTPFLMTSPIEGMGHGHYMFQYRNGEDVLQSMPKARNTAYTEFGVPSPSSVEQLKSFIPADELYPPRPGTAWESHHAFHALSDNMWLMADQIEHYLGPWETLEQLVEYGQLLQSEGYKCIYEEARRQKPICSMALNWCYNEPWPTAANNSIIMYPAKPKPAYYAVQASCRPVLASARIPRFTWKEGEWFEPELWMLNDSAEQVPAGRIEAWLTVGSSERQFVLAWDYADLASNENRRGPTARIKLPRSETGRMRLELIVVNRPEWNSEYVLSFKGHHPRTEPDRNTLNFGS